MQYIDLKKKCLENTTELIKHHDWISINKILKDSPTQLTDLSKIIEKEIIKEYINKDNVFIKGKRKDQLERPIIISLELLIHYQNTFSLKFKRLLCDNIISNLDRLNEDNLELFVKALGINIIVNFKKRIIQQPKIIKFLILYHSEKIQELFPQIINQGWYDLGFTFIQKYPPILKIYSREAEKIFLEHKYNYWQYKHMRDILGTKYSKFIDLMDSIRNKRRSLFYDKLTSLDKNSENQEWLRDHEVFFSVGVDLFTEDELKHIIIILLNLEIHRDHQNIDFQWINLCLLQIGWAKKRHIFEEFIEKLFDLDYLQVIEEFFKEFPSKIKIFKKIFLKNPSYIYSDLFIEYFDYFEIENPKEEFKQWLTRDFPISHLIGIFYYNKPELENEFTKILEEYYTEIDFGNPTEDLNTFDIENILFQVIEGYYPKYSVLFLQKKLREFLSNLKNIAFFNPYLCIHLANNFNHLEKDLQDQIFSILLEKDRLETIARYLIINFSNFKQYINKILEYKPKDPHNVRAYLGLIQIIIRKTFNEQEIFFKCMERLNSLGDLYEKAQLYSYLGKHEKALISFQNIIETDISIPSLIYTLVDYKLEYFESNVQNFALNDFISENKEINELKIDFNKYNLNNNRKLQFDFKLSYYCGRLLLSEGILSMNYKNSERAGDCFKNSYIFLSEINNSNLPHETRIIINSYEKIESILNQIIQIIQMNQETNYEFLNSILDRESKSILKEVDKDDIKLKRLHEQLSNLVFDENGQLGQLKCELPAPFCPRPPIINRKYLQNGNKKVIYEWDDKNLPKLYYDPIFISKVWEPVSLTIEFASEENTFEYNLNINPPKFIYSEIKEPHFEKDLILFYFFLKAENFSREVEIELLIKPNDRCAVPLILKFPVQHVEQAKIEDAINKITSGYSELDLEINKQLSDLGFWNLNALLSKNADIWIDIIKIFFKVLNKSYDSKEFFRIKAQDWTREETDMNPWVGGILEDYFQDRHKDHSSIAGGDADHWVDTIPIEDKLLRSEENLNKDNIIDEKFQKHKKQLILEAGKSGYGVCIIADIREEIKNNSINPFPLKKCFKVFYENNIWMIVFLLQAFTKTPSKS